MEPPPIETVCDASATIAASSSDSDAESMRVTPVGPHVITLRGSPKAICAYRLAILSRVISSLLAVRFCAAWMAA